MSRFLDWLDEAAGGVIRIAYLIWGIVAVAAYFGDGTVDRSLSHLLIAVAPWVLASALEVHTYLTARRVRAAWQTTQAAVDGTEERGRAIAALKVNLGILAGLLSFSMWNQLQYLGETWQPPHTVLALPGPLAYLIRAAVTPLAFMAAAFLAPVGASLSAQVQSEAHHVAAAAFKVARQQWRARLQEMKRQRLDVTAALVQLVEDPAERRIIGTIHQAMYPGEDPSRALVLIEDPRPPAGPGSPAALPGGSNPASPAPERRRRQPVIALVDDAGTRRRRRTASAEMRVRALLEKTPGLAAKDIARRLHISDSTASKYRRVVEAERDQLAEQIAQ